jgi:hypothetical protein
MTNAVIECILSRSAAKYYDPATIKTPANDDADCIALMAETPTLL